MSGKYRVSYHAVPSEGQTLERNGKIMSVEFKVTWNGSAICTGRCYKTAIESKAILEIQKVYKNRRMDFTPSLPAPARGNLQLVDEPFEHMEKQEQVLRAKYGIKKPGDRDLDEGIKRF